MAAEPPAQQSSIVSPCIQICRIDPLFRLCLGCGRSMEEIGRWGRLTDGQRDQVMDQLPERMKYLAAPRRAAGLEDAQGSQ